MSLSLRAKLLVLAAITIISIGALIGTSVWILNQVKVNGPVYSQIVLGKDLVADILPPPAYILEPYAVCLQMLGEKDPVRLQVLVDRGTQLINGAGGYRERHDYWEKNLSDRHMREFMIDRADRAAREFLAIRDERLIPLLQAGKRDEATVIAYGPLSAAYETHRAAIDEVVKLAVAFSAAQEDEARRIINRGWWTLGLVAVGLVAAALIVIRRIDAQVMRALRSTTGVLDSLAAGRPAVLQPTGMSDFDALTDAVDRTISTMDKAQQAQAAVAIEEARLKGLLAEVLVGARAHSSSLHETAGSTAAAAEQVSASVQSVAGAMSDLSNGIRQLSEHTSEAAGAGREAASMAGQIDQAMGRLNSSNDRIGAVVKIIQGIASKTNLLALNATIEAASAGEAGRAFSVVATEVKQLANQAASATDEITRNIALNQEDARSVLELVKRITVIIGRIDELQQGASRAAGEQLNTTEAVNQHVTEAAAGTNEIARRITEVADLADRLRTLVKS